MVDGFLRKVKDSIVGNDEQQQDAEDTQQVRSEGKEPYADVRPASEDPYGDPGDQEFADVRPASEDPYGDPADQQNA
jgi:hypothetical protein